LQGKTVNVKWYPKREDSSICPSHQVDMRAAPAQSTIAAHFADHSVVPVFA